MADVTSGDWGLASASTGLVECRVIRGTDFEKAALGSLAAVPIRYLRPQHIDARALAVGDLLVEMSGGSEKQATGRALLITDDLLTSSARPIIFSNFVKRIRFKPGQDPLFLRFLWERLYRQGRTRVYERRTTGIRNFKLESFLADESVAVPPLAEQRAIASVLCTVQQAQEATEHVVVAARELKGSLLRDLFTFGERPRELSGGATGIATDAGTLPPGWAVGTLVDVALSRKGAIVSGPFGSNIGKRFFVESGIPLIRGNNLTKGTEMFRDGGYVYITAEKAAELANCEARPGDVVFTAAGTIGQVGVIPENAKYPMYVISNKQLRVRLDRTKASPAFLYYWFTHDRMQSLFEDRRGGSGVPMINLNILKSLPIPIPPLDVQDEIAEIARAADRKIAAEEQRRDALAALFDTLLHDLMSASVRVPASSLAVAAS